MYVSVLWGQKKGTSRRVMNHKIQPAEMEDYGQQEGAGTEILLFQNFN